MRTKLYAGFVCFVCAFAFATSASAQVRGGEAYTHSYSSNGFSGHSYSSGPVSSGRWEYVPGGVDANGFRVEPKLVQRQDPFYGSSGTYRRSESWSRYGSSSSYSHTDSNGTYYRSESSGRNSSHYYERYTPRR